MTILRALVLFAPLAGAQTADEVVAKALKARGGEARIRAIRTQRLTGHIKLPDGEGSLVVEFAREGKMREMVTLDGKSQVRTTDGLHGWAVGTLRGVAEPQQVGEAELKLMAGSADFEGPLIDYKRKGNRIELVGREDVESRPAYKLLVTMKDGEQRTDYIDAKTFLEVRWEGKGFESYFHDYRKVKGIMYSFEIVSAPMGKPSNQRIVFDKIEVSPKIDESRFAKP